MQRLVGKDPSLTRSAPADSCLRKPEAAFSLFLEVGNRVPGFSRCRHFRATAQLRKQVRIGSQDLKIAAIALAQGALLLSANLRDFRKVPGLQVENWLEE
jgi:tRNA(fMet)-specific endonuclease VapC